MKNLKDYLIFLISSKKIIISLFFLFLIGECTGLYAQTEPDTTQNVQLESGFQMTKSPWGAVARSAILPGWGQYYNESYWKIPLVWGFLGYYTYGWIQSNNDYKTYQDLYTKSLAENYTGVSSSVLLREREFYRDQRDLFAVYFGLAYFLTLVDSYVDAHLFDFDVTENPYTKSPELKIRYYLR